MESDNAFFFTKAIIHDFSFGVAFVFSMLLYIFVIALNIHLLKADKAAESNADKLKHRSTITFFFLSFATVLILSPWIKSFKISADGFEFERNAQNIADITSESAANLAQEKLKSAELAKKLANSEQSLLFAKQQYTQFQPDIERMYQSLGENKSNEGFNLPPKTLFESVENKIIPEKLYSISFTSLKVTGGCETLHNTGEFFWELNLNDDLLSKVTIDEAVKAKKTHEIPLNQNNKTLSGRENEFFTVSGGVFERDSQKYTTVGVLSEVLSFKDIQDELEATSSQSLIKSFELRQSNSCGVIVNLAISSNQS